MPISTNFTYVPLVGENNLCLFLDPLLDPPDDTVFYPAVRHGADVILKSSKGDGETTSLISKDPEGRPGSLRTTLLFQLIEDVDVGTSENTRLKLSACINIPPGMQGLVPDGLSEAQINNPKNFPIMDPSQFMPRVQGYGACGPWTAEEGDGPDQEFPYSLGGQDVQEIPPGFSFTGCAEVYAPPQSYGTLEAAVPGSKVQAGAYGVIIVSLIVSAENCCEPTSGEGSHLIELQKGTNLVLDVDFSHSISN